MINKAPHIIFLILMSSLVSFSQVLNDQCNGPNIGSGNLYAKKMIGCVPFTVEINTNDSVATGHKFIYDYKGGFPTNPVEQTSHTYNTAGAYKILQITYRKEDGKELRVCGVVTVLDTNKLILKPKICDNKVSLEISDIKKSGVLPYDFCIVDWGDGSATEKVNLPTSAISHNYATKTNKKITLVGRYEVDFCATSSSINIEFPKENQPQISLLEKIGQNNFTLSFNNQTGENVKILANNIEIASKTGEIGLQKISFTNTAKNVCYALKLESACFQNNVSKEICDIDFEVSATETTNELKWKQPKPETIRGFVVKKNTDIELQTTGFSFADTAIKCNQQNCYQISFISNETNFISEKICLKNSLIECFINIPLYLPLAFSPNNDGINDTFNVIGELEKFISLTIFDQKGKQITVITNPAESWNGENYLSGVYPYKLKAKNAGNEEVEILGRVLLIR
jgi:gliding motility-associated-like protein